MPTSVLRRYTPPTCTLEIVAAGSPLSRWTDRPVVKNLHFHLSFDDPRLIHEDHVTLQGDRIQLEALCESVTGYVQQLLDPDYSSSGIQITPAAINSNGGVSRMGKTGEPLRVVGNSTAGASAMHRFAANDAGIYLTSNSLIKHELFLGSLANEVSGPSIQLSALQLFDLANALDEYAADLLALPALGKSSSLASRRWLQAVAVLVLAVGVSTSIFKYVTDLSAPSLQTATTESAASTAQVPADETLGNAKQPASSRAETRIPPDLRPLPPGALSRPTQPAARPNQSATPRRAPAGGRSAPSTPANGNQPGNQQQARPIPALPSLAPVSPQIATAPPATTNGNGRSPQTFSLDESQGSSSAPTARAIPGQGANGSASADLAPSLESQNPASLSTIPQPQAAPENQTVTAFDVIPQVAEARDMIQQSWVPPQELNQTLEYRLLIGADGSILQITPLGEASRIYFDRTSIPTVGSAFVSPLSSGQSARIRLVLSPDGRVQSFLESLN